MTGPGAIEHLRGWIGRSETSEDVVTPRLVREFRATLGHHAALADGDQAPPAIHWCLAPPAVGADGLGSDGHPAKGGFLPPVPLPRRMWAGGRIEFIEPLRVGDVVTRTSRIEDVSERNGRSGRLVFVTVAHEYQTRRGLAVRDWQDIVYREAQSGPSSAKGADLSASRVAAHAETVHADPTLLFRYSALTFNGHRIHYDRDYARDVEGYGGLVVHGPLQATLLVNFAARLRGSCPRFVTYRGVSPLLDGQDFTLEADPAEGGFALSTRSAKGTACMTGSAVW